VIRHIIHQLVDDLVNYSKSLLQHHQPTSIHEVRLLPPLIQFSPSIQAEVTELKRFLFKNLYRHPQVVAKTEEASAQIHFLFEFYTIHPNEIPEHFYQTDLSNQPRRIAHYIAGMTDRFARREYIRLSAITPNQSS
jgi:dGTPase